LACAVDDKFIAIFGGVIDKNHIKNSFKEGFLEFLKKKNINYQGRIPYTVLISQYGEVVTKYVGTKSPNYLRNKIIKEIYQ